MQEISILIKPVSGLCNLKCEYCFYLDELNNRSNNNLYKMKEDTVLNILNKTFNNQDLEIVSFIFQGGEPLLAGIEFYNFLINNVNLLKQTVKVYYSIQTNLTLLNDDYCKLFKNNDFLVGVSFDLLKDIHNKYRDYSYDKVLNNIKMLKEYNIEFNIFCTLNNEISMYPDEVFNEILENNFIFIQFTPCMSKINEKSDYALTPKNFAAFYKRIFDLWYQEYEKEHLISIKLFDDLINILAIDFLSSCGMDGKCSTNLTIESNGDVYPCDFYCLDEYKVGNINKDNLVDLLLSSFKILKEDNKLSICDKCNYKQICNGGCKRLRPHDKYIDNLYCGYKELLDYILERLINIIEKLDNKEE